MRHDDLVKLDMGHVLHPHAVVGRPPEPLILARGRGALVWDVEGREYVDGTCGLWQCAVGHGREELAEAAARQMRQLEFYASFWDFSNEPAIRLAARLAELAPSGLDTIFFTSGGSEGVETALKLVRRARTAAGEAERTVVLARTGAYHGMGLASLAAGGLPPLKEGFEPLPGEFVHLTLPHALELGERATDILVEELERTIEELGPERVSAFIGEPIVGVGGAIPPPPGYWPRVEEVCRRHEIFLILDEVITGYGRTGHWFAAERYGVEPDLIVTAKALTSGYVPMGAVLVGSRVMEALDGVPFRHGFTYNGHPVGAAVGLANLDIIEREGLLERAERMGEHLLERLRPLEALPHVREVRGAGLMIGIELLPGMDAAPVAAGARGRGVIVRATGHRVVMSPPLVIDERLCDRLADAVRAELEGM